MSKAEVSALRGAEVLGHPVLHHMSNESIFLPGVTVCATVVGLAEPPAK